MSAGTLTLTNNSAVVAGKGTAFTTEVAAGDFIVVTVGGVPYTLPIKSVESGTALTLVSNYTGPTQSGAAWSAVPRMALNMVTAALVAQSAEALRGLNYDKQNWQQFFTAEGDTTITLPDTSQVTGPSAKKLINSVTYKADKVDGAVPVNQGGTGSTTAGDARTNLGLGTAATANITTSGFDAVAGRVMTIGSGGWMETKGAGWSYTGPLSDLRRNSIFYAFSSTVSGTFLGGNHHVMNLFGFIDNTYGNQLAISLAGRVGIRSIANNVVGTWREFWTTGNTTVASDGTIKQASPIARIAKSKEECQRSDIAGDGFLWSGCGTANAEAEGVSISRLDIGVYVLTGAAGLASEGWQLLPPMDPGGMGELGIVEAEEAENGEITIFLYKRKYMLSDEGEIVKTKGDPIDVPANSWIDVRLDMPENSIWNQCQAEAQKDMEQSEQENQADTQQ